VTPLTLSSPAKATLFPIILWRCWAASEHGITRPRTARSPVGRSPRSGGLKARLNAPTEQVQHVVIRPADHVSAMAASAPTGRRSTVTGRPRFDRPKDAQAFCREPQSSALMPVARFSIKRICRLCQPRSRPSAPRGYADRVMIRAQAALPRAQKQDTDTGRSARAAAKSTRWRSSAASAVSPHGLRQSSSPRRAHRLSG
jgi:hypothetical protein